MSDENRNYPPENQPHDSGSDDALNAPDLPASTIFVEMMRQAAARRSQAPSAPEPRPAPEAPAPRRPHVQRPGADLTAALFGDRALLPPEEDSDPPAPEKPLRSTLEQPLPSPRLRRRPLFPEEGLPAAPEQPAPAVPDLPAPAAAAPERMAAPPARPLRPAAPPAPETTPPPPTPAPTLAAADAMDDAAMTEQRVRRVQRRQERRRRRRVGIAGGFVRTALVVLIAAGLASTIFTWFTAPDFINPRVASDLQIARSTGVYVAQPTTLPTPNWLRRIGIVSGHRGPQNDPGAVCERDGVVYLTEAEINFAVAQIVVRNLRAQGYSVDLLDEFDPRLDNYQAAALISIHANTCKDWGERVSGFLVAKAAARPEGGLDTLLAECVADAYGLATGLERRYNLTIDMTDYHNFREIHTLTPAAIIELGFMKDDQEILTQRQDDMGRAITEGLLCFLAPQNQPSGQALTATPGAALPTLTPGA
ncbi:MAG: N-acetylmuramoyl-L-alanine amidase [Anaerolineae bacterium]|jgi:N-acetylmuramoyl-L-alanine amidase|nr:N-acetylmuramoyl-L-alanine amidase [Anaerolineae bacterium]